MKKWSGEIRCDNYWYYEIIYVKSGSEFARIYEREKDKYVRGSSHCSAGLAAGSELRAGSALPPAARAAAAAPRRPGAPGVPIVVHANTVRCDCTILCPCMLVF